MAKKIKILGFAGSLRKQSFNRYLLRAASQLLPPGAEMEIFDIEGIPPYNDDNVGNPHPRVAEFKAKIKAADALVIVTPEYNYSVPGVLKNAIDSASRPYGDNSFNGKPLAIMGAATGMLGTARAQYHLRQSCVFLNMFPVNQPEVMVTFAKDKFTEGGELKDETARGLITQLLAALVDLAGKLNGA